MGDGGVSHSINTVSTSSRHNCVQADTSIGGMTVHTEATSSTTTTVTTFLVNKKFIVESQHVRPMHKQQTAFDPMIIA